MKTYNVKLNGEIVDIYNATVSAEPYNKVWDGVQRSIDQTEQAYFVNVDIEDTAKLEITVSEGFSDFEIRPLRYDLGAEVDGNTVTLTLTKPMQFTFEADGYHNALHIFVNAKQEKPDGDMIYFGKGEHYAGLIYLKSGQTLFLDDGAIVYGVIYSNGEHDIKVMGRGILDSSPYRRGNDLNEGGHEILDKLIEMGFAEENCSRADEYYTSLFLYNCKNVLVEGITLRDAMFWAVIVRNECENVVIDNIKLIGQWRYNSDGIDICASKDIIVKNCFIRSFDDCFVARGAFLPGETGNVENMVVENCVLWCDWGKSLEIWCGNKPCIVRNITFKDIYIIRLNAVAISIATWFGSSSALVENISYQNIFIDSDKEYRNLMIESPRNPKYVFKSGYVPNMLSLVTEKIGKSTGDQGFVPATDLSKYKAEYKNISLNNVRYKGQELNVIVKNEPPLTISGLSVQNCDFKLPDAEFLQQEGLKKDE